LFAHKTRRRKKVPPPEDRPRQGKVKHSVRGGSLTQKKKLKEKKKKQPNKYFVIAGLTAEGGKKGVASCGEREKGVVVVHGGEKSPNLHRQKKTGKPAERQRRHSRKKKKGGKVTT